MLWPKKTTKFNRFGGCRVRKICSTILGFSKWLYLPVISPNDINKVFDTYIHTHIHSYRAIKSTNFRSTMKTTMFKIFMTFYQFVWSWLTLSWIFWKANMGLWGNPHTITHEKKNNKEMPNIECWAHLVHNRLARIFAYDTVDQWASTIQ